MNETNNPWPVSRCPLAPPGLLHLSKRGPLSVPGLVRVGKVHLHHYPAAMNHYRPFV
jgi:hypothetical protein